MADENHPATSWENAGASDDSEKRNNSDEDAKRRSSATGRIEPFGDETHAEVKYRTLSWWQCSLLMIAETISLGILSLPSVLASVGLVAGIILITGLGICATYSGFVYGQFKLAYPHVANLADVGEVFFAPIGFGRAGREVFGFLQTVFLIFILGSHLLTFTIAMNTITGHATCTIVWSVVGLVVMFLLSLPRTLKAVSYFSIAAFISIVGAVFVTVIAAGIENPGADVEATVQTSFQPAFTATLNICFAFAGHMAFLTFISEMREPRDFPKALIGLQSVEITLYLIAAIVIYVYIGQDVASPALGSTAPVVRKVAYGIALPTIVIAGVIYANVIAKQIYLRIFEKDPSQMGKKSFKSVGTWVAIIASLWLIAWIIAESIPVFNDLNSLIAALFASWTTYGMPGAFWLFINYGQWFKGWRKCCLTGINLALFALGAAICGIGLYASGKAIHDDAGQGASWSCADNSV
ncbi:amino acid transporter like [Lecanosticta acicola]|uniref:Amino acid transporter like n=1 Tax=Lecanosticta acicola TaxID=111012 RepID=A0AAI9EAV7_9PEZI|nr:amino acid transporter like [Lecanosticta acicola]